MPSFSTATGVYVGGTAVTAVYQGGTQVWPYSAPTGGAQPFTDDFNRADGAPGNGWTQVESNIVSIVNGAIKGASGSGRGGLLRDLGSPDGTITFAISGTGGNAGVYFRALDASNYLTMFNGNVRQCVSGALTNLTPRSGSAQPAMTAPATFSVALSGNTITVTGNGVTNLFTAPAQFLTATQAGPMVNNNATFVDSFSYTP